MFPLQSVSFQDLGNPGSGAIYELNATDPLLAPPAGLTAFTPDQIHMTLAGGAHTWEACHVHAQCRHLGQCSARQGSQWARVHR